ncbi:hypothetical protein BLIG_00132 [Bifidobacterium longum subsp. infantis CCUG 52486]|uniref:Uncharacterized protein n=1 Tax=Bifidobacterium longum subsp. infantis CCUG 52486 TaxID=537937 RepID=C5E8G6_BIFLI|nr:hypothetical protein BLIG_00132 [Bifidobacterium longum subsp. infantis CCUG 52486]
MQTQCFLVQIKKRARLMCGTGPKTHVRQRNATTYLMLVCA